MGCQSPLNTVNKVMESKLNNLPKSHFNFSGQSNNSLCNTLCCVKFLRNLHYIAIDLKVNFTNPQQGIVSTLSRQLQVLLIKLKTCKRNNGNSILYRSEGISKK